MDVFEAFKSLNDITNNDTKSDDEVVASYVPPRYLFILRGDLGKTKAQKSTNCRHLSKITTAIAIFSSGLEKDRGANYDCNGYLKVAGGAY